MALGRRGEDLAHRYLARNGYRVVARNYRPPSRSGEIDLVAWDGDVLVFVEVKTRTTDEYGSPESAVDRDKQSFVDRAARDYARRAGVMLDRTRFDVVSVIMADPPRVELLRDAFRIHC
jgi:putative endonuclease